MRKNVCRRDHKSELSHSKRKAFLLLAVLLVLAAVTLAALAFSQSMLIGHEESRLAGDSIQARYAADSGIDAARLFLASSRQLRDEAGGTYSNPNTFQAISVASGRDPLNVCNYTLVAPDMNEEGQYSGVRFGLHNESARLNVNALPVIDSKMSIAQVMQQVGGADLAALGGASLGGATGGSGAGASAMSGAMGGSSSGSGMSSTGGVGRSLLMALPGMTEDIADAILDFIDSDDDIREYGAERDYYAQLPVPYAPVNGPLQSIEQLLLVKGVTPQLLFGLDQNRNGVLETSETASAAQNGLASGASASSGSGSTASSGSSSETATADLGWAIYLTLYSKEKNVSADGSPRININSSDLATLQTDLAAAVGEDLATFIIAYRVNSGNGGAQGGQAAAGGQAAGGGNAAGGGGAGGGQQGGGRPGGGQGGGQGGGRPGGGQGGGGQGGGPGGGGPAGGQGGGQGGRGGRVNFALNAMEANPFLMVSFLQQRGGGAPGANGFGGQTTPGQPGFGGQGGGRGAQGPQGGQGGRGGQGGGPGAGGRGGQGPGQGGPGQGGPGAGGRGGPGQGGPGQGGPGQGGPGQGGRGQNGNGRGQGGGPGGGGGFGGGAGGAGGGGMAGGGMAGGGAGGNAAAQKRQWKADYFAPLNIDTTQGASGRVKQVLDLIGAEFTATVDGEQVTFTSPLEQSPIAMAIYLPSIMDKLTAVDATVLPGRININEAPREILAGLPGMDSTILDSLIEARSTAADNQNRKFETWPMVEGIITLQQMQAIAPLLTGGGDVMRVQSVGYYEQTAGFARTEAVIDASGDIPVVALYRKMDHLGRGFSQSTLGQRAIGAVVSQ